MRFLAGFVILVAALLFAVPSQSQTIAYLSCVVNTANPNCGTNSVLRGHNFNGSVPQYVQVAGYYQPSDSWGGLFQNNPCTFKATGDTQSGQNAAKIKNLSSTVGIWAATPGTLLQGQAITDNGYGGALVSGTTVSLVLSSSSSITINPAATKAVASDTFTFTNVDNGGTVIQDFAGNCFYRQNYRGDPHEWGAYGDNGTHEDAAALQQWLSWTPGPWVASVPANYQASTALVCPANTVIQGFANDTAGKPNTGGKGEPTVRIFAPAPTKGTFSGGTALMTMQPYCRISGITLDAQNATSSGTPIDVVDIAGTHAVIDSHSLVENGNNGVVCPGGSAMQLDGLQIKDVEFENAQTSAILINAGCENTRLIGDLVENSGTVTTNAPAVSFASKDITIANGIIEGSSGPDLYVSSAGSVVVSGMTFAGGSNNAGSGVQAPTVELANSTDITLTGNRFQGGGGDNTLATGNSDVLFSGTLNNVTLSNNIYSTTSPGSDANVFPSFIYDVMGTVGGSSPPPTLTNVHLYETPERPAISVFASAIAQALLAPLQVPQFTNNQLSGLTLSNGSTSTQINIASGSAADSSNSTLITLLPPASGPACVVDLTKGGAGGLDTGPNTEQANTTYYIFLIAAANGSPTASAPTPSCMASTSLTPTFSPTYFATGSAYMTKVNGATVLNSNIVYNVTPISGSADPLAGVMVGANIVSGNGGGTVLPATTIAGFSANLSLPGITGTMESGTKQIESVQGTLTALQFGMAIADSLGCIPANAYVTGTGTDQNGPYLTISKNMNSTDNNGNMCQGETSNLSISGARQLILNGNARSTSSSVNLDISTGYYRLIGALYTSSGATPPVVQFTQDGDTFYLKTPVVDINTAQPAPVCNASFGTTAFPCALSVPCGRNAVCSSSGINVEAFGRIVGGNSQEILLSSPDATPAGGPSNFPGSPGYTTNSSATNTAFPFRLYTNTSGQLNVQAQANTTQVYEVTDGWVFHRAQ